MTAPAITIRPEAHVSDAARLMTENGIKRLPVVDSHGTLLGIVTRADLVRAFARPDHEIEREIREDVIRRILWIEAPSVVVRVERGEARLSGRLDRRADAELLEQFVARVPGVVSVHSTLRWSWDDRKVSRDGVHRPLASGERESVEARDRNRISAVGTERERRNDRGEHEARRITMKTIVLGYDDSDPAKRALERAAELATAFGAKVIVTSVAPMLVGRAGGPVDPADPPDEHKRELTHAASFLAERRRRR